MKDEWPIVLSGIGGQGVQLAATVLASAAIKESNEALLLATYTGAMRGGQSSVALVLSPERIVSPPVISEARAGVILHRHYADEAVSRIRPDGLAMIDSRLVKPDLVAHVDRIVPVDTRTLAADAGSPSATSMVMVAAFAAVAGLVGIDSLVAAMAEATPAYRADRIPGNEAALRAGYEAGAVMAVTTEVVVG